MHERSERAICRLVFVIFCAVPTLSFVSWALVLRTPWYHAGQIRTMEEELTRWFGVRVAIEDLRHPTPQVWELRDVRLSNPETGAEVASARTVLLTVKQQKVYVHLSQPELRSDQIGLAWEVFHRRLLCQPDVLDVPLQLRADDLSVRGDLQGITLTPAVLQITPDKDATLAQLQFAIAGQPVVEQPPRIQVRRSRGTQPQTTWMLDTQGTPLPCGVLADYMPAMRSLGPDATFSGVLRIQPHDGDYAVSIEDARFARVNMLDLTEPLDDPVRGMADIDVDYLYRRQGAPVTAARGELRMRGAQLQPRLLAAVAELFRVSLDPRLLNENRRVVCDLVSMRFLLDDQHVQLLGTGDGIDPGLPAQTALVAGPVRVVVHAGTAVPREPVSLALQSRGGVSGVVGQPVDWRQRVFPDVRASGAGNEIRSADRQEPAAPRRPRVRLGAAPER